MIPKYMLANMKVLKKLFFFMILIVGFQSLGYAGEKKLETIKVSQLRTGGLIFAIIGFLIIWYIKN